MRVALEATHHDICETFKWANAALPVTG